MGRHVVRGRIRSRDASRDLSGSSEDYTSRRDLESSEIQHVISKTYRVKGN